MAENFPVQYRAGRHALPVIGDNRFSNNPAHRCISYGKGRIGQPRSEFENGVRKAVSH